MTNKKRVLIVDDDRVCRESLAVAFTKGGFNAVTAGGGNTALAILKKGNIQAVVSDVKMDEMDGMELFSEVHKHYSGMPFIFLTAYATIESAVELVKKGAYDYFTKPVDIDKLMFAVNNAICQQFLKDENEILKKELKEREDRKIVYSSKIMQELLEKIEAIAPTDATVLVTGESGVGKELIVEKLHIMSKRADMPLVKVHCGAIPELDEISELSPAAQVKILRVLQEHEFEKVGGEDTIKVDVRVVAATNKELPEQVKKGLFREDLYYRLNIIKIDVPPLRKRKEDIPILTEYFLSLFNGKYAKDLKLAEDAVTLLSNYIWPGNVRELRNTLENAVLTVKADVIDSQHLLQRLNYEDSEITANMYGNLRILEKKAIMETLNLTGGDKEKAARILGIGLKTLYRRLEEYKKENV
ncbi:MAG: sigma-54-dependent Fis family transcriptional regulator [Deltaproteobacteria bacterium]|nr:sigma-54-dependent Fis family transcriptional regulator [Deltaproteobacteria bacterium]